MIKSVGSVSSWKTKNFINNIKKKNYRKKYSSPTNQSYVKTQDSVNYSNRNTSRERYNKTNNSSTLKSISNRNTLFSKQFNSKYEETKARVDKFIKKTVKNIKNKDKNNTSRQSMLSQGRNKDSFNGYTSYGKKMVSSAQNVPNFASASSQNKNNGLFQSSDALDRKLFKTVSNFTDFKKNKARLYSPDMKKGFNRYNGSGHSKKHSKLDNLSFIK